MKKIVGIIGNGFVGESQAFAFSPTNEIRIYDVDPLSQYYDIYLFFINTEYYYLK